MCWELWAVLWLYKVEDSPETRHKARRTAPLTSSLNWVPIWTTHFSLKPKNKANTFRLNPVCWHIKRIKPPHSISSQSLAELSVRCQEQRGKIKMIKAQPWQLRPPMQTWEIEEAIKMQLTKWKMQLWCRRNKRCNSSCETLQTPAVNEEHWMRCLKRGKLWKGDNICWCTLSIKANMMVHVRGWLCKFTRSKWRFREC